MKNIKYQQKYIKKLCDTATDLLDDEWREGGATIVFKAPTGSGKTYMISQAITKLVKEQAQEYAFMWLSVNKLHEQSRESLERYFEDERLLDCIGIDDLQDNVIEQNEVVFVNWDSLIKRNNIFRMDNELDWNLQSVVENTREEGKDIILIIDESHRTAKADKAKEVIEEINPVLTIEMTATPKQVSGSLIEVHLAEVIAEGMIKSEVRINPGSKNIKENKDLLEVALKKREYLKKLYREEGAKINPLLLIQIPNKKQTDTTNPEDYIVGLLADHNVTESNGKLAIRISGVDIKELDEKIKPDDSEIEVLLFKEAIALGWDCPRASLLFLQREWKEDRYSFNIQTLGRIMRMPEQKHYDKNPNLNYGYVYSASDNFEIVQELAGNYMSELQLERDEELNTKPIKLRSEFIRRKPELTRLSGEFKKCLFEAAQETGLKDEINVNIKQISKTVALEGRVSGIDKEQQEVEFEVKKSIKKDRVEVFHSYVNFCSKMSAPYAKSRSTDIIKSAIRSWFKKEFELGDEDKISLISMFRSNNPKVRIAIEIAKDKYANLPKRDDKVVVNENWEVPLTVSIFTDYEKLEKSKKSIVKEVEEDRLFVRKNKNGKIELSKPEISFIEELDATDDDILWWYKNGVRESRFFGIAYKKKNSLYYGFYPDFLIKTKKETLIVEIKDDKDFRPENTLKLQAGRDYVAKNGQKEKVNFYMLSPMDYSNFFAALKDQELNRFKSLFEERLLRYNQSQKKLIESKQDQTKKDIENLEWLSEFDKTIDELEDQKLKNELLQMELLQAKKNISVLSESAVKSSITKPKKSNLVTIKTPFNICVLGEVSDTSIIRNELNNYFHKIGVQTTDWKIEFFNNAKLQNSNVLRSLQKGQSKFDLIITGQIYHHSGRGNTKCNIISELKKEKYIPHLIGSSPKNKLTPTKLIACLSEHFNS